MPLDSARPRDLLVPYQSRGRPSCSTADSGVTRFASSQVPQKWEWTAVGLPQRDLPERPLIIGTTWSSMITPQRAT
eukprot:5449526-Prorocentrum_lima.AAC.1